MNSILFLLIIVFLCQCINARGPPTFLSNTSNFVTLNVSENQSIELHCPVMNSPDLSIQWSKNNEDLDPMWSSSNLIIKRLLLKIHQAQITDAGLYKCNVVNGFGNIQAQFQVNVQSNRTISNSNNNNEQQNLMTWDVDSINGEAPAFVSRNDESQTEPTRVIQPEGTTVQLKCLATGKPSPEIRWKKNGKILSEDEYGVTQSQILIIRDLRQTDTGNYTCELFNSFGTINTTFILAVTEKLQFFDNDPQNKSVEFGQTAVLNCRVQTNDPTTKIQWLKKLSIQQLFRADAIVFGSEQYETIDESQEQHYTNNILSKTLIFPKATNNEHGQYICLIQNDKATNYRKAFINVIDNRKGIIPSADINNNLLYVIIVPLCLLGLILFLIFCCRQRRRKMQSNPKHQHSHSSDIGKTSIKTRQPLIHHNGVIIPTGTSRTSNDYLATSVDSIPITRQQQQHQQLRYGPTLSSDIASLTSSNLYYARVQAL